MRMVRHFTEAQLAILEREWGFRDQGASRPHKRRSITVAMNCSDVGPRVTSQDVGRYVLPLVLL